MSTGAISRQTPEAVPFAGGCARMVRLGEIRGSLEWQRLFAGQAKDHRFYEIVEQTLGSGFQHRYLIFEDELGAIRGIQPVFFVRQNLTEGLTGSIRSVVNTLQRKFPRLMTMKVLMAGCAAGEGHLGACAPEDEEWLADALRAILPTFARRGGASLVVLKDFPAAYRQLFHSLRDNGFARVPSMPMTQLRLSFRSFEEYLATLSKPTRKSLRRKLRKSDAAGVEFEVVTDIRPIVDELHALYLQVHNRSAMKFERLTKEFFCEVAERMPDCARFFVWRYHGRIAAFSLCFVHDGVIYDDCVGLDYPIARDLHLYFHTFRDIIAWALCQGLQYYYSNPLNYDPKLHLKCELRPLDLYVRHISPWLNPLVGRAVRFLEPTRHDPVLKQFANAWQLQ